MSTTSGITDRTMSGVVITPRRDRDIRPHVLEQIDGPGSPARFSLAERELVIGRADDAAIRVESQLASRHHAVLTRHGEEYSIQDNDSRNGIFLNGLRVHSALLRDGDILLVAEGVFVYHEG